MLAGRTDLRMTTRKLGCLTEYPRVPPGAREVRQPRRHEGSYVKCKALRG